MTTARPLLSAQHLAEAVERMAREISSDHPDGVVLVAVLRGAVFLLSDLARLVSVPVEVDFLSLSKFAPDSGRVRLVKDLEIDISGRSVVIVEDVIDTGLTLTWLLGELRRRGPASLEVCAMLDKQARRLVPVSLRYVGHAVPDEFLLGYGLDYDGRYRNLDVVVAGDVAALRADPDAHVAQLYDPPSARPESDDGR